jgi:DNA repair exonuclease SbcCD ATPase subunit
VFFSGKSQVKGIMNISLLLLGTACGTIKSDKPEKVRELVIREYVEVNNPELVSRVETLQNEIDTLREELEKEQNSRKELEQKLAEAELAAAKAKEELGQCKEREAALALSKAELEAELERLKDATGKEIEELKDRLASVQNELGQAQAVAKRLNEEIRVLQNRAFVIKVKISDVQIASQVTACDGKANLTLKKDKVLIQAQQTQRDVTDAGSYGIEAEGANLCTINVVRFTLDVSVTPAVAILGVCQGPSCEEVATAYGAISTQAITANNE